MGKLVTHIFLLSHKHTKKKRGREVESNFLKNRAESNSFHELFCSINLAKSDQYCHFKIVLNKYQSRSIVCEHSEFQNNFHL